MRDIINLIDKFLLNEARMQPLLEFANDGSVLDLDTIVSYLSYYLGEKLYRVGGPNRVYEVDRSGYGAVYVIGQTSAAFGVCWPNKSSGIRSVYVWTNFSLLRPPEFCFDLPRIDFDLIAPTIAKLIQHPKTGRIEVSLDESRAVTEKQKTRTTEEQFVQMVRDWASANGKDITKISFTPDLMNVSDEYSVLIPGDIKNNKKWKTKSPNLYDFSSGEHHDETVNSAISNILGSDIQLSVPSGEPDETWDTALSLAKVKQLKKLNSEGKVVIFGRKNGKYFSIPRELFDQIVAIIERMLAQSLQDAGDEDADTVETQYQDLAEKVKHIASGKSSIIKSLLVTGTPSSGKTFIVMNVVENVLKMMSNRDYAYKKGNVTVAAMYRILIEQCNGGLAIFDDCDSVTKTKNGLNMLKGALDTTPIRQVDYDLKRGIVNTAVLPDDECDAYVTRLSELLRGRTATIEDAEFYSQYVPRKALMQTRFEKDRDDKVEASQRGEEDFDLTEYIGLSERQARVIDYVKVNLPNRINFKGRMIFISNMSQEAFSRLGGKDDSSGDAFAERAFRVNIDFTSGQLLSYIEKIQNKIEFPALTAEEKRETLEYLRHRYAINAVRDDINFRLVITAFEYRVMGKEGGNWKRLMNGL